MYLLSIIILLHSLYIVRLKDFSIQQITIIFLRADLPLLGEGSEV